MWIRRAIVLLLVTAMGTCCERVYAQKESTAVIDSLLRRVKGAREDTNTVALLSRLSYEYADADPDEGIKYGVQAQGLAAKLSWKIGLVKACRSLSANYLSKSDYAKALACNEEALSVCEQMHNKREVSSTLNNVGMVYLNQGDYKGALDYFQRSLAIAEELGYKEGIANEMSNMGLAYDNLSNYPLALECHLKGLKVYEEEGNKEDIARETMNIGIVYSEQEDHTRAQEYFMRALKLEEEAGNKSSIAYLYMNLSFNSSYAKDDAHELEFGLKALKMFEELGDKANIAGVTGNLCIYYQRKKDYTKALEYAQRALQMAVAIGARNVEGTNLYNAGNCYLMMAEDTTHKPEMHEKRNLLNKAIDYLQRSLALGLELHEMDLAGGCYQELADAWKLSGNYQKALECADNYHAIHDSLFTKVKNDTIASLAYNYELDKKQSRIALLEKDKQLDVVKIRNGIWLRNTYIICSILLLGLATALFLARLQRNRKHMQVAFTRSLMQQQEAERQRISRELHDSIGQNILFIKNQLSPQHGDESFAPVIKTIAATIEDVRNISKELYPNQLEKYGLAAAIDALAQKAQEATGIFISADLHEVAGLAGKEASINLYRIVQEALNNIIKHAGAKAVRITGARSGDKMTLTIQDNGKGFDTAILERKAQRSYGLLNMEERAKMLGGEMALESSPGGTKITITIPIKHGI